MTTETLILKSSIDGTAWFICYSTNPVRVSGRFEDHLAGVRWAIENGYRVRVHLNNGKVKFYSPSEFSEFPKPE